MNGFLHRLAQRANGTARLARATAAAAAGWSPPQSDVPELLPALPARAPANIDISGMEPAVGSSLQSEPNNPQGTARPTPFADIRIAPSATALRGIPPGPDAPLPGIGSVAPIDPNRDRPAMVARTRAGAEDQPAPPAAGPRRADPARPALAPRLPGRAEATTDTLLHRLSPQRDLVGDIAPALVPLAPAARLPGNAPAWVPDRTRAATRQAEETTEVHVSIGRIEVTALQAAAPPARKTPRAGRAPMSLDDYLARRRGQTR